MSAHQRLGDVLLERALVTPQQLEDALARQRLGGRRLGEVLLAMNAITQEQLSWALSEALHIPFVELSDEVIDLEVARSLPESVLRRHEAMPVLRVGNEMTMLLADPTNRRAAIEVEALSGSRVTVALAQREAVLHFLDRAFPNSKASTQLRLEGVNGLAGPAGDLTGVSQVFALLLGAARDRASELYLDPLPNGVLVRVRVDGRLLDRAWFDRELLVPLTFRLRLLAGLRGESAPRTARLRTRLDGRDTELEFLFFPTLSGEATAIRFHPVVPEAPTLERLDVSESTRQLLAALVRGNGSDGDPGGIVLVAGTEAATRVQVLYALAREAACRDGGTPRRVLTIERRTAFTVPGFLQVELAAAFEADAATVLAQSAEVSLVEDITAPLLAAAALAGAERGTLVLAGLGFGSERSALAYLGTIDLRGPMLTLTRGVVVARHSGGRLAAEALALTPAVRRDLIERKDPWTSLSS